MNARFWSLLLGGAVMTACASPAAMQPLSDAEARACEAQGGSIEPAYAIDAYVCLLPPTTVDEPSANHPDTAGT
ncbi:MAG: hypothetical protein R3C16_09170 [Hyphomonadaceae bacterium]